MRSWIRTRPSSMTTHTDRVGLRGFDQIILRTLTPCSMQQHTKRLLGSALNVLSAPYLARARGDVGGHRRRERRGPVRQHPGRVTIGATEAPTRHERDGGVAIANLPGF